MQNFELLLLLTSMIYLGFTLISNRSIEKRYILSALVAALLLHLIANGPRWQMIPSYLIWILALVTALRTKNKRSSILLKIFKGLGLITLIVIGIIIPSVLPVFELPETTGTYLVGTTDLVFESERNEEITPNPSDKRSFMIKVWYPTNQKGEMDPYIDPAGRNGFAQKYGLPPSLLGYLDKVNTSVYKNVAVAEGQFPVLIFSHGYNSKANGYYAILSELTSHGYIVFSINHTYESTGTTFPDGSQYFFDYEYAGKIEADTWQNMEPVIEAFKSDLSFEERHPIVKKGLTTYFVRGMVERWSEDIVEVVDHLNQWNRNSLLAEKMDLTNIGVLGHSRGGGAAGESLLSDNRIKAGANIDGVQWGQIVDTVFQQPFLFISADWPEDHEDLNQHAYINKSTSIFYEAYINGSAHSNFMDIPFMIPLRSLSQAGEIDPRLGMQVSRELVVSFFDRHLKQTPVDFQGLSERYDQLELSLYRRDSIMTTDYLTQN